VNLSTTAWNTSQQLANLSQSYYSLGMLNLSTNYWKTNSSLSTVLSNSLTTQPLSISTVNCCVTNASFITFNCSYISASLIKCNNTGALIQRVFTNNNVNMNPSNYASAFTGYLIQKSLISTINTTNTAYQGVSTYYAVRISGYICPGATDTYTFQLYSDDSAILYINDTVITSCTYLTMPTTGSIALTAGVWYPIVIEHTQGNGGEQMTINYKNTTNQTSYTTMTHSTAATGIQMAYDNDEVMPSRTGTLFVDGTLVCPSNVSCNSVACTSLTVNGVTPATQSYVTGLNYITATPGVDLNLNNNKLLFNGTGIIYFYANSNLATTFTGARIVLWPGSGTPSSTDWYGFGMNGNTLVYNVPSGMIHSFQVNGTQIAYINSAGITVPSGTRIRLYNK